jgi:hypothetical protein
MGAANMMAVNLAIPFSLSTLIIASLHHSGVELSMDDTVASWFGEESTSHLLPLYFITLLIQLTMLIILI